MLVISSGENGKGSGTVGSVPEEGTPRQESVKPVGAGGLTVLKVYIPSLDSVRLVGSDVLAQLEDQDDLTTSDSTSFKNAMASGVHTEQLKILHRRVMQDRRHRHFATMANAKKNPRNPRLKGG